MRSVCPAGRAIEWKREVVTEQPLFTRTVVLHVDDATPCRCKVDGRPSGASPLSLTNDAPNNTTPLDDVPVLAVQETAK